MTAPTEDLPAKAENDQPKPAPVEPAAAAGRAEMKQRRQDPV